MFVRAGTILPRQPVVQSTLEIPAGPLYLDVYPGADCAGTIYLDDGHSMAFAQGHYLRQTVQCSIDGSQLVITFGPRDGDYRPWWKKIEVLVHGRSKEDRISSRTAPIQRRDDPTFDGLTFDISDVPNGAVIAIDHVSGLIGS